jgi:hypothetical protein
MWHLVLLLPFLIVPLIVVLIVVLVVRVCKKGEAVLPPPAPAIPPLPPDSGTTQGKE